MCGEQKKTDGERRTWVQKLLELHGSPINWRELSERLDYPSLRNAPSTPRMPDLRHAIKIARHFNVAVEDLFDESYTQPLRHKTQTNTDSPGWRAAVLRVMVGALTDAANAAETAASAERGVANAVYSARRAKHQSPTAKRLARS